MTQPRIPEWRKSILNDFSSSIIVFLVALPLCLGIAMASKAPEFSGIIAGIVGGLVVGVLSGSSLSVTGPAAGLSSLVAVSLSHMPFNVFLLSVLIAGGIQILLGCIKLGVIGFYIPNSVISGMLGGIGLLLILKQLQHLVGYDKDFEGDEAFIQISHDNTFSAIVNSINGINLLAASIGLTALVLLIVFERKWFKKLRLPPIISGPLVAVLVGAGMVKLLGNRFNHFDVDPEHLVHIPIASDTHSFLKFFQLPDFTAWNQSAVWSTAIILALIASVETLLSIEAIDKLDPENRITPTNRELIAQGSGNMICGLIGGLPITSVIVRSSANVNGGAKTKWSAILHGLLLLLCVILIPHLLNLIPKASLAAILIFTGYKMIKPEIIRRYYKLGWSQFVPFMVTLIAVVSPLGLLYGVLFGLALGIVYSIRVNFRNSVVHIQDGSNHMIQLQSEIFFFTKPILKMHLQQVKEGEQVIIDISETKFIDRDIQDTITEFSRMAASRNIQVEIKHNFFTRELFK